MDQGVPKMRLSASAVAALVLCLIANLSCAFRSVEGSTLSNRTITVAQSGQADLVGSDSATLQKAADMLRPGDTLTIGPGTYRMDNSLLIPSGVTVRGVAGRRWRCWAASGLDGTSSRSVRGSVARWDFMGRRYRSEKAVQRGSRAIVLDERAGLR